MSFPRPVRHDFWRKACPTIPFRRAGIQNPAKIWEAVQNVGFALRLSPKGRDAVPTRLSFRKSLVFDTSVELILF